MKMRFERLVSGKCCDSNVKMLLRFAVILPAVIACCSAVAGLTQTPGTPPTHGDYTMPPSGRVTVPAEGGLIFQMKVNGQGPFSTVFDTGAVNVISTGFAKQLGLMVEEKSTDFGAIGGAIKVRTAHVDALTIGDLVVKDQLFYVLDIPSDAGTPQMLVGWELMQRFAVRMDFKGQTFQYAGHGDSLPLLMHKDGNGIDVEAKVDGIPGRFLLDSGNQTGLFLSAGFVKDHHLVEVLGARYRGYNGRGFGGPSPEVWFVRLHTFELGQLKMKGPIARLQTANDGFNENLAGNIGQDILNRFIVIVDCIHAVMYLEKNTAWNKPGVFNRTGMIVDYNQGSDEVKTVFPGSPAEAVGLKAGDRIVAINGNKPSDDPNDPVFKLPIGTVLHLDVRRGETSQAYNITLRDVI
jgi:hypothetical protein